MAISSGRIRNVQEICRNDRTQSRKESRSKLINSRRHITQEETRAEPKPPVLSDTEKLRIWRMEKKKRMDEEKLRRRPPFISYINVKHTGFSPYKSANVCKNGIDGTRRRALLTSRPESNSKLVRQNTFTLYSGSSKKAVQEPPKPVVQLRNLRSNRNALSAASKPVAQVENKPVQTAGSSRPPRVIKSVNKTENKIKPVLSKKKMENKENIPVVTKKRVEIREKIPARTNNPKLENNVNIPFQKSRMAKSTNVKKQTNSELPLPTAASSTEMKKTSTVRSIPVKRAVASTNKTNVQPAKAECNTRQPSNKYNTRSSRKIVLEPTTSETSAAALAPEPLNGPSFQRARLLAETNRLETLRDIWLELIEREKSIPESVNDEILSVTGLTSLLISSKFEQFRSLIDGCALQMADKKQTQSILPDDLDGFWDMMYLQVEQLRSKYLNLDKLKLNNWIDPLKRATPKKTKSKKSAVNKNQKTAVSRFQEFLSKKKETTQIKEEEEEYPSSSAAVGGVIGTPLAVRNLLSAKKTRRSSLKIVMSMSGVGKFDISGTSCQSPRLQLSFNDVD